MSYVFATPLPAFFLRGASEPGPALTRESCIGMLEDSNCTCFVQSSPPKYQAQGCLNSMLTSQGCEAECGPSSLTQSHDIALGLPHLFGLVYAKAVYSKCCGLKRFVCHDSEQALWLFWREATLTTAQIPVQVLFFEAILLGV